jgi:hypothetical protein
MVAAVMLCQSAAWAFASVPVNVLNENATLAEGVNVVVGGKDFKLPAAYVGAQFLIANDSGMAINLIPSGTDQSIGTLPPGYQGILSPSGKLELIGIGYDGFYVWSGAVANGGDPFAPVGTSRTEFSELPNGSGVPAGWTERWATGVTAYTVQDSVVFSGLKELKVTATTADRRLLTFDAADNLGTDVDLLMLFRDPVNEGANHTDIRLQARSGGGYGGENSYFFTTLNNQSKVAIYKYVNGVLTVLSVADIAFNTTDRWWVRFRVEEESLKAKIWPYGSVEPSGWQLSAVDLDIPNVGWQGIGNYYLGDHLYYEFAASALPVAADPVRGYGITSVYPAVTNLDAEAGSAAGWENEFGTLQAFNNYQRSGNFVFQGTTQNYRAYQRIDLAASGITPSQLDSGAVVSFRAWQKAFNNNNDPGRIGLRFLDLIGNEIRSVFTPWDGKNTAWVPKGLVQTIPANAAYVDILLEGQYVSGGSTGAYFDDLEVGIAVK